MLRLIGPCMQPFCTGSQESRQIYFSINMKSSIKIELANRKLGTNLALTFGQLENYDCGKGQYVAGVLGGRHKSPAKNIV